MVNFSNFKNEKQTSQSYNNFQHRDGEADEHSTPPTRQGGSSDRTTLPNAIRTSYTQILVNPMQLQDHEFTAWLERLVEARKKTDKRIKHDPTETTASRTSKKIQKIIEVDGSHSYGIE